MIVLVAGLDFFIDMFSPVAFAGPSEEDHWLKTCFQQSPLPLFFFTTALLR
ncbi:MAG: hypothetical protein VB862_05465 [Pirellulaceae bacterium]